MGIPVSKLQKLNRENHQLMLNNTLNHSVPNLAVEEMDGTKRMLHEVLLENTLLFTYWDRCGFCAEEAEKNLKLTIDSLSQFEKLNFVILLNTKDSAFSSFFHKVKNDKTDIFFIADSIMDKKLNSTSCSKYFLNKDKTVLWYGSGINSQNRIKALEEVPGLIN
tara:strand:+ start:880 stop:1371 length:492 start_codon:yes stop_codon:yes gene_type:complete